AAEHVEGIKQKIRALYSCDVSYEDFLIAFVAAKEE
nr:hypothetical protein [Tanacetum cinerariifolium]